MLAFLILGCVFPLLGWITVIAIRFASKRASAILIPFIGPILINIWSANLHQPWWAYIVPWMLDISTLLFLFAIPNLAKEVWNNSSYNNLITLHSSKDNQTIVLKLQRNDTYIIRLRWTRKKNEFGVIEINDFGAYKKLNNNDYQLKSHAGNIRVLKLIDEKYLCSDSESSGDHNIDGYIFS